MAYSSSCASNCDRWQKERREKEKELEQKREREVGNSVSGPARLVSRVDYPSPTNWHIMNIFETTRTRGKVRLRTEVERDGEREGESG